MVFLACLSLLMVFVLKARDNRKRFKEYLPLQHLEKTQQKELPNDIIKDAKCDVVRKGKSYTFKNPKTKLKKNKNLTCNSKNVVCIIEYSECKEIYIGSTQALNTRTSLYRSNINIEENRKLNVSKHLYQ